MPWDYFLLLRSVAIMKTITFYAYKGGTGRSLVVANVAKFLARFGQKVFVVDLDLEAAGLHYKLSNSEEPLAVKQGVVDFFHQYKETDALPASLGDYILPVPLGPAVPGSVNLMPAGTVPAPGYWRKLAGLNWHDLFYRPGAKGVALFLELKERIRQEFGPDFLLIDARTGITEVGGIATTLLPDVVVCLLLNNRENLDGVRVVLRSIQRSARFERGTPVEIIPVLTRIPKQDDAKEEDALSRSIKTFLTEQAENLEDTLDVSDVFLLHSDPSLELRERILVVSEQRPEKPFLLMDYLRLFARLISAEIWLPSTFAKMNTLKEGLDLITTFLPALLVKGQVDGESVSQPPSLKGPSRLAVHENLLKLGWYFEPLCNLLENVRQNLSKEFENS